MDALRVEREGHVLRVTLARPERRNAFDAALIAELTRPSPTSGTRARSILAGEGPSFCAGADVEWQRSSIDLSYEENVEDAMRLYRMCEVIDACPAPVVARVHGYALGGGAGSSPAPTSRSRPRTRSSGSARSASGSSPPSSRPSSCAESGPAQRGAGSSPASASARTWRFASGSSTKSQPTPTRRWAGSSDAILAGGPEAVRAAKSLARDRPFGSETAEIAAARRTSEEGQAGLRAFLEKQDAAVGIRKLLVANRGEIAVRVFATCERLGIGTVAVAAPTTRARCTPARAAARRSSRVATSTPSELVAAAARSGADAIHPGYGFLAESSALAEAVDGAGLTWVGPPPDVLRAAGDKLEAKRIAAEAGVPSRPDGHAEEIGFPLVVKAAAGGGGRGMRVVRQPEELDEAVEAAQARGQGRRSATTRVFFERYVERPRHVEVQLLADAHGTAIHLGERDCSVQRRHQKVLEESPSPALDAGARAAMGERGRRARARRSAT